MDERTSPDFAAARRFEHELTDRQHDVLALIARGHTNAEIAEQLDVPLTAVKWHVSEVLAKLGFASREEAGEFWRWRNSTASRVRFRAASLLGFGLGVKKSVIIGATALAGTGAIAAVAVALFATSTSEDPALNEPGQPFYLEARHTASYPSALPPHIVEDNGRNVVVSEVYHSPSLPPSDEPRFWPSQTQTTDVRWWFNTPDVWKWERDVAGTRRIQAADGQFMWLYPLGPDSYQKQPLVNWTTLIRDGFAPQMEMVGPSRATDIDELLAALSEQPGQFAEVVGTDTVLGRETTVIRYGPRGMGPGDTEATTTYRGEARIWLDAERMMIMRAESDLGNGYKYAVEVTRLDWGYVPTAGQLAFNPPAGTSEGPRVTLAAPPEGVIVEHYR